MADWSKPALQRTNPAAPEGLRQAAGREEGRQRASGLQEWVPQSYVQSSQTWFGGQNNRGMNSGWETDFWFKANDSYASALDAAAKSGKATDFYNWFSRPGATGIATWADPSKGQRVGDIYENGRKLEGQNLYDVYGDETANLMIGKIIFEGPAQARFNRDSDPTARWGREVKARTEEWTRDAANAVQAEKQQDRILKEQKDLLANDVNTGGLAVGSAVATAAMTSAGAAALGFSWTGPGALVAAGVAGVTAGISAWYNRDQLTEIWAAGNVKADAAVDQKYGRDTAFFQQLGAKGQLAVKLVSPFQNAVQGAADEFYGSTGDAREEFYETDADGKRVASGWFRGADLAASFADSMLQFAGAPIKLAAAVPKIGGATLYSPGAAIYMAGTGASVVGQTGTLATSGAVYNDRTGRWDPIENTGELVSALGGIGAEALSMGLGAGIANSAKAGRKLFGGGKAGTATPGKFDDAMLNGMKFSFDDAGNAVRARATAALLMNPEELLKWVGTTWRARSLKASGGAGGLAGGGNRLFQPDSMTGRFVDSAKMERVNRLIGTHMPGPDDYYRAALEMAHNTRFADAIVNGWAEGVLEATSAIFEPLSVSEDVSAKDVFTAYAYGFAGGLGMSTAGRITGTRDANIQEYRAKSLYMMRHKITDLDEKDWDEIWSSASSGERQRMAIATAPEAQYISEVMQTYKDLMSRSAANSTIGINALNAWRAGSIEQLHANENPRLNSSRKLLGLGASGNTVEGVSDGFDYPPNSGVQSAWQTVMDIEDIRKGFLLQIHSARESIADWTRIRDADTTTAQQKENAQAKIDEYTADLDTLAAQDTVSKEFADNFYQLYEDFRAETDRAAGLQILADMNELLSEAYEGRWMVKDASGNMVLADAKTQELVRRAVELVVYRPPAMDDSSALLLRMQISPKLTEMGEHSKTYIANMLLKAPNADHDGDQGIPMFDQYLSPTARQHLRRGGQYLVPVDVEGKEINDPDSPHYVPPMDNTPNAGKYAERKIKVISDPQDGFKTFVDIISESTLDPNSDRSRLMQHHVNQFFMDMLQRYGDKYGRGPVDTKALVEMLAKFEKGLKSFDYKAQETLLDEMFTLAGQELMVYSDKTRTPEMLWVGWRVNVLIDNIQRGLARKAAAEQKPVIPGEEARLPEEHAFNEGVAKRRAAQDGMTISLLLEQTSDATRQGQALHYSPFVRAAVESLLRDETGFVQDAVLRWEEVFANLGSGITKTETERVEGRNAIENRVVGWLADITAEFRRQNPNHPSVQNMSEALVFLGQMAVQDVEVDAVGSWRATGGEITLLQALMKRSIWVEKNLERSAREESPELNRIRKLEGLTKPAGARSVTASKALLEVLGNQSLFRLVGEESDYLGGMATMNQLVLGLQGLSDERREAQIDKWQRLPGYFNGNRGMNPPYTADYLMSGDVNAFTMIIDSIAAVARTDPRNMEKRNQTSSEHWLTFHESLKTMRKNWKEQHNERLNEEWEAAGNKGAISPEFVLRDMLSNSDQATQLIADIIPEASVRGIFSLIDGEVWTANWLEQMLLEDNSEKAELMYFLFSKLAELNVLGGDLRMPENWDKGADGKKLKGKDRETARKNAKLVNEVAYDQIKSRFLRKVYVLAKDDPTGYELNRLLLMGLQSSNVHEFLEKVSAEPNWGQGEKRLLAYFDDVAQFEVDPKDFWTNNLPGALQREALMTASQRMQRLSMAHAEAAAAEVSENLITAAMLQYLDDPQAGSQMNAAKNVAQVEKALALAKMFPDAYGIRARMQFMELIQSGVIQTQNKGGPDASAAPMGAPAATMDDVGFKDGLSQEFGWQTRHGWRDIMINPSKMVEGPLRVMLDDGRIFEVDFSTTRGLIEAMQIPQLRPMVKAALFPTVRDINENNVSQTYQVHQQFDDESAPLVQLLEEADLGHLFSSDGRLSLDQAERIIEMLDSGIRQMARTNPGSVPEDLGDQPIMQAINTLLIAYTHAPGGEVFDRESQRIQLLKDVAEAVVAASLLKEQPLEKLREKTQAYLLDKYLGDRRAIDILNMSHLDKDHLDLVWANANLAYWTEKAETLVGRLDPNMSQQEKDALQAEIDEATQKIEEHKKNPFTTPPPLPPEIEATIEMFVSGVMDPDSQGYARLGLLEYLSDQNRIERFLDKDDYRLAKKVREIVRGDITQLVEDDPQFQRISPEEWQRLGNWGGYIFVSEIGARGSSNVGLTTGKLGSEGRQIRRYYDHTWMNTTDFVFNPVVLEVMRTIRNAANYRPAVMSDDAVLGVLKRGILNPKKLGKWTSSIVTESVKAEKVLQGASVLPAIQRHGTNPQTQRDYDGTGWVNYTRPKPEHMSSTQIAVPAGVRLDTVLSQNPQWFIKLENHFYETVRVLDKNGVELANLDRFGDLANYDMDMAGESSTAKSGYRVFSTLQLQEQLDKLNLPDDVVIDVKFVDVDKKPHTREYVNSIYFDGLGPSSFTGIAPGPAADMIFGSSQVNKLGQQGPLDFAARAGKAFMQGLTTPTERTQALEDSGASLADIIYTKTIRMWTKEYETGSMPWGSLPGLYKHMKMRHILRGTVNGKLTFMWAEEAIGRQARGEALGFDKDEYQLVSLEDNVLMAILGKSDVRGAPQALTMAHLNLQDIDTFPSLDLDRMRRLGLLRLGERVDIRATPLAQAQNLRRQSSMTRFDSSPIRTTPYEEKILHWQEQIREVLGDRDYLSTPNSGFHVPTINQTHLRELERMLAQENLAPQMARFGIPFSDINDMDKLQMTKVLMQMIQPVLDNNPSAMVWRFSMDLSPNPAAGVLAPVSLQNDFENVQVNGRKIGAVYGDMVVMDLSEILEKNDGDMQDAIDQAKGFITQFAKRGISVVMASSSGNQHMRSQLSRWLREGELGYRSVAGSPHVFAPRRRDPQMSIMSEAHEATLTEVRYLETRGLGIRGLYDLYGGSEGTVYFDPEKAEQLVWERVTNTIVPGTIVATSSERTARLFNIPSEGEGANDYVAKATKTLLPLLETEEGRKYLKKQLGGNPDDVPIRRKHSKDGSTLIDPGVLDIDDAVDQFIADLKSGSAIVKPGAILTAGQIYAIIDAQNEVVVMRHGFKLPKAGKMFRQFGETMPGMDQPLRVAFSSGELENRQSITPPVRIDKVENLGEFGIQITGTYPLDKMSKELSAGLGYKAGFAPLPDNFQFHPQGMSPHVTISAIAGTKAIESKQAGAGTITDYRWGFLLTGIDFRENLVRTFFGDQPMSEDDWNEKWNYIARFLEEWTAADFNVPPDQVRTMLGTRGLFATMSSELNHHLSQYVPGWKPRDFSLAVQHDPRNADLRISEVILATLMTGTLRPEHVLGTRGLLNTPPTSSSQIALMPPLLTEALGDTHYPEVTKQLFEQMNSHLPLDAQNRPLYELTPDWTFHVRMVNKANKDASGQVVDEEMLVPMNLQIYMGIPSESNSAALNVSNTKTTTSVSTHLAATFGETLQSWTAVEPTEKTSKLEALLGEGANDEILRFDRDDEIFWDLFRRMKKQDESYSKWTNRRLPLQQAWIREADEKRKGYEVKIDKTGWDEQAYTQAVDKFFSILKLDRLPGNNRYEVDFLVRQFWGKPGNKDNVEVSKIEESDFLEAVGLMTKNVKDFLHPLHGGMVPLESEAFWAKVHKAQEGLSEPWQPLMERNWRGKKTYAATWDEWVTTLIGQLKQSNQEFFPMFRKDLDGFWHTYQGTTPTFANISLSMETQLELGLMDKDLNEYVLSLDPSQENMWSDPVIIEIMGATLDTLTGHAGTVANLEDAKTAPVADFADQRKRIIAWLNGNKMGKQEDKSIANYFREGAYYQETTRQQSALWANLNNLQLLNRLFNPEIAMSSVIEVPMRNAQEHITNLIMGTYTGKGGQLLGRGSEDKEGLRQKWGAKFTTEELQILDELAKTLAGSTKWRAELFGEMMYKSGTLRGASGWRSRKLERAASAVARGVSNPTIGMLPKSVAKRYLDAVWEYMSAIDQNITVAQFAKEMKENTLWMKENSPEGRMNAHKAGVNRVAQAHSAKQSTLSKVAFKYTDRLSNSNSNSAQFAGFLFNLPFYFRRFNVNSALSLTGLTGFDQVAAMMLDARPQNSIIGRVQAGMRGEDYVPTAFTDYSDVLEGVDLTRPFVRGAITQTGLMLAGLLAGGLKLDGEDDEAKRRRRMAEYLNVPLYLDPMRAENDYLYADAIFLDSVPGLASIFKDEDTGRSAILPPWYMRQFTSPMMGIQRFFNTGDLREVMWGFQDAAAVIPYSAMNIWREAHEAADVIAGDAAEIAAEGEGTPESRAQVASSLVTIAMIFEKALIENSFVNGIRNSSDEFDRDPWKYAATADENTGEMDRLQGTENTQQSKATGSFFNEETGQVETAYLNRADDWSLQGGNLHNYAENNATFALLASLFTGQIFSDSNSYARKNMAIKERSVELPEITKNEAKAYIMAAYHGTGGQVELTEQELIGLLKFQDQQAGVWWDQADIEARAAAILASHSSDIGGMSLVDDEVGEIITKGGARAVLDGLWKGTVDFDSASLQGMFITREMREELQAEMFQDLITDGVNKGMSHEGAYWYAKRLWDGDKMNPDAPGIGDLLWSDEIPYYGKVKYNQLNTTYMIGPNGQPVATPFQRKSVAAVLGLPIPTVTHGTSMGMTKDKLGKSVDEVAGINTGLHGLARKQDPEKKERPELPTLAETDGDPKKFTPWRNFRRFPRRSYGRRSYGRGGGGGGYGGSSYGPNFQRMQALPQGTSPRIDDVQMINTSNPQIRRSDVRRERITSERGRLKQWQ